MEDIKIEIPKGYEIDKEKSVVNLEKCIVDIKLKKKTKRWRDNEQALIGGYFISTCGNIGKCDSTYSNTSKNHNLFATEKQAKSALAMARISQIMANDARFGGVITDEEWVNNSAKYVLQRYQGKIYKWTYSDTYEFLAFHTKEQRELFLEENEDLVKDYLMID